MKQVSIGFLLLALMFVVAGQPTATFARSESDDGEETEYHDDDSDDGYDEEENLEVEAKVFTDTTVVKVELSDGTKMVFSTEADTEEEVIEVVAEKFDLTESEVESALEFEIEDRASRMSERSKIKDRMKDRIKVCRDDSSGELEVEAKVFTDTTVVKVELPSGLKKVFETKSTSSASLIDEVADRYDLDENDVKAVFELEVEDRASRVADRAIAYNSADCDDERENRGNRNNSTTTPRDTNELRTQVEELQRLLNTLIRSFLSASEISSS